MYDNTLKEYNSLDDDNQIFDLVEDIEQLHRFRIINKSLQSQVDTFMQSKIIKIYV